MSLLWNNAPLFVSTLEKINQWLRNEPVSPEFCFYGNQIAIQCRQFDLVPGQNKKNQHEINICKTNTFMNGWWYERFDFQNHLVHIYFNLDDERDRFLITNWIIRHPDHSRKHRFHSNMGEHLLTDDECLALNSSLMQYIQAFAQQEEIKKIIMYTESDNYTKYFEKEGFIPTGHNLNNNYVEIEWISSVDYCIK